MPLGFCFWGFCCIILLHYIEEAEGNEGVESVKLRKNQGFEKKKRKSEKRC